MALNGKVNPYCNYASNPYHECTEPCLKRIAEGKGRKDRKKPVNGAVPNKRYEEKKGSNGVCHRAGNPYHECNENCFGGAKKMNETRSMPPREVGNGRAYNSSASMPPARYRSSENGGSSSEAPSGEIQLEDDSSFYDKKLLFSPPFAVPASGILSTPPPKEAVKRSTDEANISNGVSSFSFSGVVGAQSESDGDENEDARSDSSVSVGKYRVKGRLSPILQSILDRYGDIGGGCQLESVAMRSYYLECVCFVVQELQVTKVAHLTGPKLKEMQAILKDVDSSGVDVAWLRRVLSDNANTVDLVGRHRAAEEAIEKCAAEIEETKVRLEEKEKEVTETRARLRELEKKSADLVEAVASIRAKVDGGKSLLDGVL